MRRCVCTAAVLVCVQWRRWRARDAGRVCLRQRSTTQRQASSRALFCRTHRVVATVDRCGRYAPPPASRSRSSCTTSTHNYRHLRHLPADSPTIHPSLDVRYRILLSPAIRLSFSDYVSPLHVCVLFCLSSLEQKWSKSWNSFNETWSVCLYLDLHSPHSDTCSSSLVTLLRSTSLNH